MKFIIPLIIFIIILLSPDIIQTGTINGLVLFITKVFPGLFIFYITTNCIIMLLPNNKKYKLLFSIISSILCGFPTGAFILQGYYSKINSNNDYNSLISDIELLENIIGFINVSSPGFIINFIYAEIFQYNYSLFKMLLSVYLPIILCTIPAYFFRILKYKKLLNFKKNIEKHIENNIENNIQNNIQNHIENHSNNESIISIDSLIKTGINNMLKLSGYIVIFSCAVLLLKNSFTKMNINGLYCGFIYGLLEITNGIYEISQCHITYKTLVISILGINAFGGFSTLAQTYGILKEKLNIKKYIYQKLLLSTLTVVITTIMVYV